MNAHAISTTRNPSENQTAFTFRFRVRYPECDAQGVVFNARYGDYADLSTTEFLRACIGGYSALVNRGLETQVVRMLIEWKGPARFDDVVCAMVRCINIGNTSFSLQVRFEHCDGRPIATADMTYVMVDAATFTKTPIPPDLRERLQQGAPGRTMDQSGAV